MNGSAGSDAASVPSREGDVFTRIGVRAATGGYEVLLGPGVLDEVGLATQGSTGARSAALVSDENVAALYGERVVASLAGAGITTEVMTIAAGETSKTWTVAGALLERLADARLDRTSVLVALGGGVVGDLGGFAAAVYLRGIPFVQVPTTLLAAVDSSVGGKTGVDLPQGKNLAGAFWQPSAVIADTNTLTTLPEAEWRSGLAEVAKAAFLDSERFVAVLEGAAAAPGGIDRDSAATRSIVADSVAFKARVVAADEREADQREILNYGHTFGHALEKVLGYGSLSHGQAVAEGIRFAAGLAETEAGASARWTAREVRLLDALGLGPARVAASPGELLAAMHSDKKVRGGSVRFVLSTAPGSWEVKTVDDGVLEKALQRWASARRG